MTQFVLTTEERNSNMWRKLMEHFEWRLDSLRQQNDSNRDQIETANLRGKIAELKLVMSLNKDLPGIE